MTDEERQKLLATLRWYGDRMERELASPMKAAAEEIEQLLHDNRVLWDLLRPLLNNWDRVTDKQFPS
jgi:hypothetical protein